MENSTYLFGRRFKNRLFVGGLPHNTTPQELAQYFSNFGQVIEAKLIFDENHIPKGYGFVTFQSEGDVKNVTEMGTLFLRNKKLNLGPAVKKQVMPVENHELVVVSSNQMRGDFYYPVPASNVVTPIQYSTYIPPVYAPECQPVTYIQQPAPYMIHYQHEEKYPSTPTYLPVSNHVHVSSSQQHRRKMPPRFRRLREN